MSKEISEVAGTFWFLFNVPHPWPVRNNFNYLIVENNGHNIELECKKDGTIGVVLRKVDSKKIVMNVRTCPIVCEKPELAFFAVVWTLPDSLYVRINDTKVGCFSNPASAPNTYVVPEFNMKRQKIENLNELNDKANQKRAKKFRNRQAKFSSIREDKEHNFREMGEQIELLKDMLQYIESGKLYYLDSLSVILSKLIAEKKRVPFMQLCAASRGINLFVYSNPQLCSPPLFNPEFHFSDNISIEESDLFHSKIDLDVWLDSYGSTISGRFLTNRETILHIRNKKGAHVYSDIDPHISHFTKNQFSDVTGERKNFLTYYLCNLSKVIVDLHKKLF
ncbi:hypothetical protein [Nisaea sp.]|uniref:hypothetical protein n=1 Tax=Nisaea sp. TaxID=2024842 RepID=UPI003B518CB8